MAASVVNTYFEHVEASPESGMVINIYIYIYIYIKYMYVYTDFNIHVDEKSVADTGAPSDHDVRYTSILEATARSAIATR